MVRELRESHAVWCVCVVESGVSGFGAHNVQLAVEVVSLDANLGNEVTL